MLVNAHPRFHAFMLSVAFFVGLMRFLHSTSRNSYFAGQLCFSNYAEEVQVQNYLLFNLSRQVVNCENLKQ